MVPPDPNADPASEEAGVYTLRISDRATGATVQRAARMALDQVLYARCGAPTAGDQLTRGRTRGPIDPADLTAADRAGMDDISRLLDRLDNARPWSARDLDNEYRAALRDAGLALTTGNDSSDAARHLGRRRVALGPELLARVEAWDLPGTTLTLGAYENKWLKIMAAPAIAAPAFGFAFFNVVDPTLLLSQFAAPMAYGVARGLTEWAFNRSVETGQRELQARQPPVSESERAREGTYRDTAAAILAERQTGLSAQEQALADRQARVDAALDRAERDAKPRWARAVRRLVGQADPVPPPVSGRGAPDPSGMGPTTPPTSADADRQGTQAVLAEVRAKPGALAYLGMTAGSVLAAFAAHVGIAVTGDLSFLDIFNPGNWAGVRGDETSEALLGGAVVGAAVVLATALVGWRSERSFFNQVRDLAAARNAALAAHEAEPVEAADRAVQASLEQELEQAKAEREAAERAQAAVDAQKAAALEQVHPVRGPGALRALQDAARRALRSRFGGGQNGDTTGEQTSSDAATESDTPPPPAGPREETEKEFFERMRQETNTTGWDDLDEWCQCPPVLPCTCRLPKMPIPPPDHQPPDRTQPDQDDKPHDRHPMLPRTAPPLIGRTTRGRRTPTTARYSLHRRSMSRRRRSLNRSFRRRR